MSIAENKRLVQRFIDEVMNAGNMEAISELCVAGSMFAGGIVGQMQAMRGAIPDIHFTVEEMIGEGDKVAVRISVQGTHNGPLVGLPAFGRLETPLAPTGKAISHSGMYWFTVADGRIQRYAAELDQIALLRQLGWTLTAPG